MSIEPQASKDEELSLRRLVRPLDLNVQPESFDQSSVHVKQLDSIRTHPDRIFYNVVLDSVHLDSANDFAVFDDVTTPSSIDRFRLENLAQVVQRIIVDSVSKNCLFNSISK